MDDIPTLEHIAQKSGFSKSTVSLALRHHPRIPAATRNAIEAVAAELNYRPDPALARIAANRWRRIPNVTTIAFITTNHPDGGLLDVDALAGARQRAEMFGYRIDHFRFEDYGSAKRLADVIYSRGIKGVILGKLCVEGFVEAFPWQHFAAIACDSGFVRPPLQMVMPDHAHAVHRAWAEAAAMGYRRIGLVLFKEYTAVDYFDKVSAYLFNQRSLGPRDRLTVCHFDPGDDESLETWLKLERPDVILGFNGFIHHRITRLGHAIPEEFGFIALMAGEHPKHDLTRLAENLGRIGQLALDQLDVLLRTNQYGLPKVVSTLMTESQWIPGSTLPRRAAGAAKVLGSTVAA
ncbi:MAG: LacI family DNA-binding transcriptional regulator [Opitutus sp.]